MAGQDKDIYRPFTCFGFNENHIDYKRLPSRAPIKSINSISDIMR